MSSIQQLPSELLVSIACLCGDDFRKDTCREFADAWRTVMKSPALRMMALENSYGSIDNVILALSNLWYDLPQPIVRDIVQKSSLPQWKYTQALYNAASKNLLVLVKELVPKIEKKTAFDTAIIYAGSNGNLEMTKLFIENGATIWEKKCLALHYAAENGHLKVVEYLLEQGCNSLPVRDNHLCETSALYEATRNRHYDIVHLLVKHKAVTLEEVHLSWKFAWEQGDIEISPFLRSCLIYENTIVYHVERQRDEIVE
jgi:ankyrin repeat protein